MKLSKTVFCLLLVSMAPFAHTQEQGVSGPEIKVGEEAIVIVNNATLLVDGVPRQSPKKYERFTVEAVEGDLVKGTFEGAFVVTASSMTPAPLEAWIDRRSVRPVSFGETLRSRGIPPAPTPPDGFQILAISGQQAPDGNGICFIFDAPIAQDGGSCSFGVLYAGSQQGEEDDRAILASSQKEMNQLIREGDELGDTYVHQLSNNRLPIIPLNANDSGSVTFYGTLGDSEEQSVIGIANRQEASIAVRSDTTLEGSSDTLSLIGEHSINDNDTVAFRADLNLPPGKRLSAGSQMSGLAFTLDSIKPGEVLVALRDRERFQPVLRSGDTLTKSGKRVNSLSGVSVLGVTGFDMNEKSQSVFLAEVAGASGYSFVGNTIVLSTVTDNAVSHDIVAMQGQSIDGESCVMLSNLVVMNDLGEVAFSPTFALPQPGKPHSARSGVVLYDQHTGEAKPRVLIKSGDMAPDGNGRMSSIIVLQMNNHSQIGFFSILLDVSRTPEKAAQLAAAREAAKFPGQRLPDVTQASALYRRDPDGDGNSRFIEVVRSGDESPDGNGIFAFVDNCELAINDSGQMAFENRLIGTDGNHPEDIGIFFYDDTHGLKVIARTEMPFLGSEITALSIPSGIGDDQGCLNEEGQVAFRFCLLDGREGIALWKLP